MALEMEDEARRILIPAVVQAITDQFTESDWKELGYATSCDLLIRSHPRLLRSLNYGDDDYSNCVYSVVEKILSEDENINAAVILQNDKIESWIKANNPSAYMKFYDTSYVAAFKQNGSAPCKIVEKALQDAEALLITGGPVSTVDRLHTALHGYLKSVLDEHSVSYNNNDSISQLYTQLYKNVGGLDGTQSIKKMLRSLTSAIDALNPIRNHGSLAHPNKNLIGDDEARLVINLVRTVFHYLDRKIN